MRTLVLTTHPEPTRQASLAPVLAEADEVVQVVGDAPLPSLDGIDAVLVDGHPAPRPTADLDALARLVDGGASLLAIGGAPHSADGFWASFLGVVAGEPFPAGEWFGTVVTTSHDHLTDRVATEFPLVGRVEPMVAEGASALVTVRRAMQDHVVVTQASRGAGRVVTSGLGLADSSLSSAPLTTVLRRALRPVGGHGCCGRTFGLAVVGYGPFGGMGYYHGLAASQTPGLQLVAAVDPSPDRRKAAEQDFPGLRAYGDVSELVDDESVEVVVIATPPAFHAGLALSMLEAGKHVALEKPMCLTVAEADQLLAASRNGDRVLTVNQNRRWDPDFVAVRRAIEAGMLGDLFNVETFVGGFEHPCRAWHSDVSVSGGAVYDWGSHHVDWVLQLLGSAPATVQTTAHKRVWHDVTNLDQLRVRMAWDDGREAEFFQSDVAAVRRPKLYVQGTAGTLVGHYRPITFERLEPGRGYVREVAHHAEAPADLTLARYESGYGITETALPVAPEQRFAFHRNLADHLHLGEPLAVTPESVRSVVAVLEAAQRSSDEGGRTVSLSELG